MNQDSGKNSNNPKQKGPSFNPFKGNNNKKKPTGSRILNYVYIAILIALGNILFFSGNKKGGEVPINWTRLEQILLNQDQKRIVVVNQEFAEITIKDEALKDDTLYQDLYPETMFGGKSPIAGHYKYEFVTFESFEKDLEKVQDQIIAHDTVGVSNPARVQEIINSSRIDLTPEKRTNIWKEFMLWGSPLLMLLFIFLIFRASSRQMGGGNGGIFSVGKNTAKVYDGKNSTNVTFKDVAGMKGAKDEVMEIVDFLKNPKRYTDLGGKIPKGALLVGPPGTGKTLLAKAVAGEANVPFFSMSGSDFVEMFVGVGASRVRDLFAEAKKKAPCIIFIDEIDAVGRARGRSGMSNANDERENTLNALLTEMDGFGSQTNVIVLAATNRAEILDKALLRAGRFDRQIEVELPDLEERNGIFEVHMRKLKLGEDVDRDFLARQTPGFAGADIANVCNEAALVAARKRHSVIEKQDFLDAIDRIVGGIEKKTKVLTPEEKRSIAYHESGHASTSWLLQWADPFVKVTIVPRGKSLGASWYNPEERQIVTYEQMFHKIIELMAGRASEEIFFGRVSTGALNDMERATKMAYSMVTFYGLSPQVGNISYYDSTGQSEMAFTKPYSEKTAELIDSEVRRIVTEAYNEAKNLINSHKSELEELAKRLYDNEVLFREDLEDIFGPRPWESRQDQLDRINNEQKQIEAENPTLEIAAGETSGTEASKPEENQ